MVNMAKQSLSPDNMSSNSIQAEHQRQQTPSVRRAADLVIEAARLRLGTVAWEDDKARAVSGMFFVFCFYLAKITISL